MHSKDALALLERELQRRAGHVEAALDGEALGQKTYLLKPGELLFRIPPDTLVHYRLGSGLTVDPGKGTHPAEIDLFCEGSIAAAVAALAGLYPFHGSAVAADGRAIILTGPSGAGKTALATGLALAGMPLLADDLSVIVDGESGPEVLPWRKKPKLWPDAFAMTGAVKGKQVSPEYAKFFAEGLPRADRPLPLGGLVLLEEGERSFEPLGGAAAIAAWSAEHYCSEFLALARRWDRAAAFADAAARARSVPAWRLSLPHAHGEYTANLDFARDAIERAMR